MILSEHTHTNSIPSLQRTHSWLTGISRMLCDILYETDAGIAHIHTTDVDCVMKQPPPHYTHPHTHTHTCQTSGCQHVLTLGLCWRVDRTEGEGERERERERATE